jgi:glycosyltransferase involved in cell wall biosynthesis
MSNPTGKKSIAMVVPAFTLGGGVPAMAEFLYRVLSDSGRYRADIFSLALSSRDTHSLRLVRPTSWFKGPTIVQDHWNNYQLYHAGAFLTELEFQRYQPRRSLTKMLQSYDLVQVVAGTPAWAMVARDISKPVCLYVATVTHKERVAALRQRAGWWRYWSRLMTHFTIRIDQLALKHVEFVFAESRYTYRQLVSLMPPERLTIGLPGIDTKLFAPLDDYRKDGYIISVGRFSDPRKNVRLLFEAYRQVRNVFPESPRLLLVGHHPTCQDWGFAERLGISDWIDCIGPVDAQSAQLADLYRNASLFVLSSDEEGLGIVILEAMASGLPVVSTDSGGPATVVIEGETGYLTPVGNAQALAEKIQKFLANPDLGQQMGHRGRAIAEQRFSTAAAGQVYLQCYDRLLNQINGDQKLLPDV